MKTIAISILAVVLSVNLSCQKEQDDMVKKTINVSLAQGETYSTTISQQGEDVSITQQAAHASVSELKSGTANGEMIFAYTPASGYAGSDQVQITAQPENQHGHGSCPMHHHNQSTVYIYNITVTGTNH